MEEEEEDTTLVDDDDEANITTFELEDQIWDIQKESMTKGKSDDDDDLF